MAKLKTYILKVMKTNPMRLLEQHNIPYKLHHYPFDPHGSALEVTNKLNIDENALYKTIVTTASDNQIRIFCLPVTLELSLKNLRSIFKLKSISLVDPKDLLKLTGYIRGGVSPLAMIKSYPLFIDNSISNQIKIVINGGKQGYLIEVDKQQLIKLTSATEIKLT
jgi:Cys-tRNA(Pro)/Cys-tRNA(Cys) deacylase